MGLLSLPPGQSCEHTHAWHRVGPGEHLLSGRRDPTVGAQSTVQMRSLGRLLPIPAGQTLGNKWSRQPASAGTSGS